MPICNKPSTGLSGNKSAAEIDDHASEAAKVKRTREQAYFNSYDFDAIEVLPYDDEAEDNAAGRSASQGGSGIINGHGVGAHHKNSQQQQQQQSKSASNPPTLHALNATSHQHPPNSNVAHSLSGSGRSSSQQRPDFKYAYLQRLGAFFGKLDRRPVSAGESSTQSNSREEQLQQQQPPKHELIIGVQNDTKTALRTDGNGNFLLPRAMLKYQSVGISNSMPLAVNATTPHTGNDKILQNANNNATSNNNNNTLMMTTGNATIANSTNTLRPSNNNSSRSSSSSSSGSSDSETRLNYASGTDGNTGFLMVATENTAPTTPIPAAATITTLARNKKQSTSSTATTTTTTTISSETSVEPELHQILAAPLAISDRNCSGATKIKPKSSASTATSSSKSTSTSNTESDEQRTRGGSHQSHYSTDKSGSSGYYSSNVCSTYSLEDHIYCEPVIDILDANSKCKSDAGKVNINNNNNNNTARQQQKHKPLQKFSSKSISGTAVTASAAATKVEQTVASPNIRTSREMNGVGQSKQFVGIDDDDDAADDDADDDDGSESDPRKPVAQHTLRRKRNPQHQQHHQSKQQKFSENLRILESSIENLDRHLKNFPSLSSQEHITAFVQLQPTYLPHVDIVDKLRPYSNLPTIIEGFDYASAARPWVDDIVDDTLLDIDLDSFLLVNEGNQVSKKSAKLATPKLNSGIVNPGYMTDEQEENNYKCVKYINSCPEDAYRVESDIVGGTDVIGTSTVSDKSTVSVAHYHKRYEDQLHFQNTRELLEDVRDKIRLLSRSNSDLRSSSEDSQDQGVANEMPKELEGMIQTLKHELETYLNRMNQHSELEIRQLCSGIVKNQNIVKMKKAFERRRSVTDYDFPTYEAIRDGMLVSASNASLGEEERIASIRCASDPNFKMKRKSLNEVFPVTDCYIETLHEHSQRTQLQRNLSFHKPVLSQLNTNISSSGGGAVIRGAINGGGGGGGDKQSGDSAGAGEAGDKDSIMEWHRKKPSIWEQYYGTNRINQSLLGKRNGTMVHAKEATMSYPSSRPESDFTLDLPRAEQLRIKMEKEKKFRRRCRYITSFLSLVFFLLTVMVVSLVLTRGKRMFGSMI